MKRKKDNQIKPPTEKLVLQRSFWIKWTSRGPKRKPSLREICFFNRNPTRIPSLRAPKKKSASRLFREKYIIFVPLPNHSKECTVPKSWRFWLAIGGNVPRFCWKKYYENTLLLRSQSPTVTMWYVAPNTTHKPTPPLVISRVQLQSFVPQIQIEKNDQSPAASLSVHSFTWKTQKSTIFIRQLWLALGINLMQINSNGCFSGMCCSKPLKTVNCSCNKERPLPVMLEMGSILAQEPKKYHDIVL